MVAPRAAHASPCHVASELDAAPLGPAWRDAVESLEREVAASLEAACHGVELVLTADRGAVRVTARAPDGRTTSRRVTSPAGLSSVAFGLLAAAPGEPPEAKGDAPPQSPDPHEVPPPDPAAVRVPPPPPPWTLSLGALVGSRVVLPTDVLVGEFEVRADVTIDDWVATLSLRAAPFVMAMPAPYDIDSYQEAGVGLGLGRQLHAGRAVFVVGGAASVTYVWLESDVTDVSVERPQLRLAAVARAGYPIGHAVRLVAAVDAEISPTGLVSTTTAGLPAFPSFTAGLRLGAEVVL
jgi:hypothetical protein